jgi:hypothetical protein
MGHKQIKITQSQAHYSSLPKECAGKQNKDLNSLHITEIKHKECASNQKNAIFLHTETVHLYSKERLFHRELPDPGRGILWRNGIPPGIARSRMWNPQEEWNSAGNYCLKDMDSDRQHKKIFRSVTIPGAYTLKELYHNRIIFKV